LLDCLLANERQACFNQASEKKQSHATTGHGKSVHDSRIRDQKNARRKGSDRVRQQAPVQPHHNQRVVNVPASPESNHETADRIKDDCRIDLLVVKEFNALLR
jgi:hypothetical protein